MKTQSFLLIPFLLLIGLINAAAQYDNVWVFGVGAGMDFNNNPPTSITTRLNSPEACASVCNANGNLLFYTDGTFVYDRNNNIMPNGTDLTRFGAGIASTPSTTQGAIIVPIPGDEHKYYIFSLTEVEMLSKAGRLYYSVVDMTLNNDLGDVISGQRGILLDSSSMFKESMTSVSGNNCNIWLLVISMADTAFKAYNIDRNGISHNPVISPRLISPYVSYPDYPTGSIAVSPDRTKLACTGGTVALYDFDPGSGKVSNPLVLASPGAYYGICFSPDNSKLYSGGIQFDLSSHYSATQIASSTLLGPSYAMKIGPDGRIYCANFEQRALDVINYPNLPGKACQFVPGGFPLSYGGISTLGLPNVISRLQVNDSVFSKQHLKAACFTDHLVLRTDSAAINVVWDNGSAAASRDVDHSGTYWVQYQIMNDPCTFHVDTFYVSISNGVLPDIHIQNACKGFSNGKAWATTYPGDTVTYHYCWKKNNGDTLSLDDTLQNAPSGNYMLRVSTAHCDTTLFFFIPEEEHHVSFEVDSIVCQGTKLQFTNTSDSSFTQFSWDFGDSGDIGLRSPGHVYKHSGRYKVTLIGKGKICMDTANKTIAVDSLLAGTFLTQPDSICAGQEAISFYPQTDSTALGLHWDFGDGSEMISGSQEKIQHAYETTSSLPVHLTTHFRACPDTAFTDTVYIYELPKVDLGPDTSLCLHGAPIILQNRQTLMPGTYHYLWSTGDTTEKLKIVHPGIYHLTVSEAPLNCNNAASIKITKDCYIDIPNAFTPNDDGENDYFFPRQLLSKRLTQFHMQIFNRWGGLIFETSKINGRGWDGRFNGKPQPEGMYVYLIDAEIDGKRTEHYQGNVTLLR